MALKHKVGQGAYALENPEEAARLERQSRLPTYDVRRELAGLVIPYRARVLDAGCGTGVAIRHLSVTRPDLFITGCDFSSERLDVANKSCVGLGNVSFVQADLGNTGLDDASFDLVICRYVFQHINGNDLQKVLIELKRVLKPGGQIHVIDGDGLMLNLYPSNPFVAACLNRLERRCPIDLRMGRKLNSLFQRTGFRSIHVQVEALNFTGEMLAAEIELTEARFEHAKPMLESILGGPLRARRFISEFLAALRAPGASYCYEKFLVTAEK